MFLATCATARYDTHVQGSLPVMVVRKRAREVEKENEQVGEEERNERGIEKGRMGGKRRGEN